MSWGYSTAEIDETQGFDLVCFTPQSIKIQVKSSAALINKCKDTIRFKITQGSKGSCYDPNTYEILALVNSIDERILFKSRAYKGSYSIPLDRFNKETEANSWMQALDELRLPAPVIKYTL